MSTTTSTTTSSSSSSSSSSFKDGALYRAIKDIAGGTVGGIGLVIVGHPFDTLKVRLQTQSHTNPIYSGLGDCVRKTYQAEGLGGFYKGVMSPLAGQMVLNAMQFMAFGKAKELVGMGQTTPLTVQQNFVAGAITGAAVALVEGPIDILKTQLQTQVFQEKPLFTTFTGSIRYVLGTHGIRGIYQGFGPTLVRNVPAVSLYFGVYEYLKGVMTPAGQPVAQSTLFVAGASGGFAYWACTYPIDVVKSTMMADALEPSKRQYPTMISTVRQLLQQGGIGSFFKGSSPCLMRSVPANAVCFYLYEQTIAYLR